jgi:hypothetical protein
MNSRKNSLMMFHAWFASKFLLNQKNAQAVTKLYALFAISNYLFKTVSASLIKNATTAKLLETKKKPNRPKGIHKQLINPHQGRFKRCQSTSLSKIDFYNK